MATVTELMVAQLTRPDIVAGVPEQTRATWQAFEQLLIQIGGALLRVAQSPPSPGYEPWFVDKGGGRLGARGLAHLLRRGGRRRARDHQWRGIAVEALRDLGMLSHRSAVKKRADTLLTCWDDSAVLETIFDDAGGDVFEFVRLLKAAQAGQTNVFARLAAIAAALRPFLTVPRGRKTSPASETHALFLEVGRDFGARAYTWKYLENDFTDAQTQATRREFNAPSFNPVPARRRAKRGMSLR